jgi:uncharacterized membrane protein YoaT (DUF817 family)
VEEQTMTPRRRLPLEAWGRAWFSRLEAGCGDGAAGRFVFEFLMFGFKQAWACLFGGIMVVLVLGTHLLWPPHAVLARYDALVLAALAVQAAMLALKLESWTEAKVIFAFHVTGTVMELFKTQAGSWIYPEPGLLRIGLVPLFSGFMYSAVGSYLARVWRIFDFRFSHYPPLWATAVLAAAIYVNFFAHHWWPDVRVGLFAATALLYARCWVYYRPDRAVRRMPLLLGFMLVALFIWVAENLGTFSHTWIYPSQRDGWRMVAPAKLGSWFLLMIVSFVMVSLLRRPRPPEP